MLAAAATAGQLGGALLVQLLGALRPGSMDPSARPVEP